MVGFIVLIQNVLVDDYGSQMKLIDNSNFALLTHLLDKTKKNKKN